jgi:hypothetical protein
LPRYSSKNRVAVGKVNHTFYTLSQADRKRRRLKYFFEAVPVGKQKQPLAKRQTIRAAGHTIFAPANKHGILFRFIERSLNLKQ